MEQVSRPLLIALAATFILAALWLVVLRPKPADVADTPAAPVQAVAEAKQASAAADATNAKLQAATGGAPTAAPVPTTAAEPARAAVPAKSTAAGIKAANEREAVVLRDIRRGRVVVMYFWNAKGADDIATRAMVRDIDRHGGKVAVHVIPISRVAQYESITQDVPVNQSPTTLVIDRKRRARTIVGLSEPRELSQAVGDALAGRH